MKRILSFVITLMLVGMACAQNARFGKPTKEEWSLNSVDYAPDASAVVLYKSVDVSYKLSASFSAHGSGGEGSLDDNHFASSGTTKFVDPDAASMMYDVKLRIKILKPQGVQYASIDVITLNDEEDMNMRDEFYEMSIVVFSQVDGKVRKKRLTNADIKDERIDKYYTIRHIRVPEAKVGDIIECQYKLFSNRITYIYDTQMQEGIPVLYSRCVMDIPHFLQFIVNKPEIPNVKASAALGSIIVRNQNNDMQTPKKVVTNLFTIEGRNIPAYQGEISLTGITLGKVHTVRTELKDKRYDVKMGLYGPVRHLVIGR